MNSHKVGIALAGGGSRGAYQVGVLRALRECGITFDVVTGTSVGALNGALFVQNDYERALSLWQTLSVADIANVQYAQSKAEPSGSAVYAEFLKVAVERGGVDISGLENVMRRAVDEARFFASPIDYGLVTVEYPTLKPMVMKKADIPKGRLCDYLIASASCFPAFPTKLIDDVQFIDGGYHDNLPINLAVELGATEVIAVDLEAVGLRQPVRDRTVKITLIRPSRPLGPFLLFEPQNAMRNIEYGYLDALRAFKKAEGEKITLRAGETERLWQALESQIEALVRPLESGLEKTVFALAAKGKNAQHQRFFETVQNLGEWYALDCQTLYTAHSFCYELLLQFNATAHLASEDISAELKQAGNLRRLGKTLESFGHRRLLEHIFTRINDLKYGQGTSEELEPLLATLRQETAAAILLHALKNFLVDGGTLPL